MIWCYKIVLLFVCTTCLAKHLILTKEVTTENLDFRNGGDYEDYVEVNYKRDKKTNVREGVLYDEEGNAFVPAYTDDSDEIVYDPRKPLSNEIKRRQKRNKKRRYSKDCLEKVGRKVYRCGPITKEAGHDYSDEPQHQGHLHLKKIHHYKKESEKKRVKGFALIKYFFFIF